MSGERPGAVHSDIAIRHQKLKRKDLQSRSRSHRNWSVKDGRYSRYPRQTAATAAHRQCRTETPGVIDFNITLGLKCSGPAYSAMVCESSHAAAALWRVEAQSAGNGDGAKVGDVSRAGGQPIGKSQSVTTDDLKSADTKGLRYAQRRVGGIAAGIDADVEKAAGPCSRAGNALGAIAIEVHLGCRDGAVVSEGCPVKPEC